MKVWAVIPWGILIGVYLGLSALANVNQNFGQVAPGAFLIGLIILSLVQIKKYLDSKKKTKFHSTKIELGSGTGFMIPTETKAPV